MYPPNILGPSKIDIICPLGWSLLFRAISVNSGGDIVKAPNRIKLSFFTKFPRNGNY